MRVNEVYYLLIFQLTGVLINDVALGFKVGRIWCYAIKLDTVDRCYSFNDIQMQCARSTPSNLQYPLFCYIDKVHLNRCCRYNHPFGIDYDLL